MLNFRKSLKSGIAAALIAVTGFAAIAPTVAMAQDRDGRRGTTIVVTAMTIAATLAATIAVPDALIGAAIVTGMVLRAPS